MADVENSEIVSISAIKELARKKAGDSDVMLVDSAAGIGCPVITSIAGSNYVIGVCEPTPSGLSCDGII